MRVRYVTTVLGLGAFALLCLVPEPAQAQLFRRGNSGPTYYPSGPAYGQPWQPGYYGSPSYWPGSTYGPGVTYGMGTVPLPGRAGGADMPYAPGVPYGAPMYQPQPYAYPPSTAPCPPGQPISPSALTSPPPQSMPSAAPGAAPVQPAATHTVNAQDDVFEPKTLTIQPGATVTWVNRGQHAHTVTFDVGRDSGDIAPGGSFSATFPHAGTYRYHCHHHPDMTGTVVVGEDGGGKSGGSSGQRY
jgi:plastocyanin